MTFAVVTQSEYQLIRAKRGCVECPMCARETVYLLRVVGEKGRYCCIRCAVKIAEPATVGAV